MTGLTREQLVQGLRTSQFQKVVFLVGAGISVAAGIPDFRTAKTGLYAQVKKMGLPVPEDIFSLEYFLHNPSPFYTIAREFLFYPQEVHPVKAHYFMRAVELRKQLLMVYTQNIDGLELVAGISQKKLVQAHGHMRSAHCISCKTEYPIKEFESFIKEESSNNSSDKEKDQKKSEKDLFLDRMRNQRVYFCNKCHEKELEEFVSATLNMTAELTKPHETSSSDDEIHESSSAPKDKEDNIPAHSRVLSRQYRSDEGGIIKPDIIFFGEKVSKSFNRQFAKISEADLVIVMGTSLKVHPFSELLKSISDDTPLVIINKELPKIAKENLLFLEGDIETTITSLCEELNWNIEDNAVLVTNTPRKRSIKALDVQEKPKRRKKEEK